MPVSGAAFVSGARSKKAPRLRRYKTRGNERPWRFGFSARRAKNLLAVMLVPFEPLLAAKPGPRFDGHDSIGSKLILKRRHATGRGDANSLRQSNSPKLSLFGIESANPIPEYSP
jgi:hypothetical protein